MQAVPVSDEEALTVAGVTSMLRTIAARLNEHRATLWLVNTTYLLAVPLCSLGGLHILKIVPWWIFIAAIVAGSVFVTRIRFVRGEPDIAQVTILWLGIVPIKWWRQGSKIIVAEHSWGNDEERPDEVTLDFLGNEAWSFGSSRAREIAAWLRDARATLREPPGTAPVDSM